MAGQGWPGRAGQGPSAIPWAAPGARPSGSPTRPLPGPRTAGACLSAGL